jgi:hypothetical protein
VDKVSGVRNPSFIPQPPFFIWWFSLFFLYLYKSKTNKTMERTFTKKEVEAMCTQSYMRGMMIQHQGQATSAKKPRKVFVQWLQELIQELPIK